MNPLNQLQKLASDTNINYDDIINLGKYFYFSVDLYSIHSVIENINNIISIENTISYPELQLAKSELNNFEYVIRNIKSKLDVLTLPSIWMTHKTVRRKNLVRETPIYAMFTGDGVVYTKEWLAIKQEYTLLMFLFIKSYEHLVETGKITQPTKNHVLGTRSIRFLEKPKNRESIPPEPSSFSNLDDFVQALEDWNEENEMVWADDFLSMANSLLLEKEGYTRRYRTPINHIGITKNISDYSRTDDSLDSDQSKLTKICIDKPDVKSESHIRKTGNHHQEFDKTVALQSPQNDVVSKDVTISIWETKAILSSIIKSAQPVVTSPAEITAYELQILIDALHLAPSKPSNKKIDIELKSLVLLSLYTGQTIEKIETLRFLRKEKFIKSAEKFLTWDNDEKVLLLPINSPNVYKKLSANTKKLIQTYNYGIFPSTEFSYYSIHLPIFATELLDQFYKTWENKRKLLVKVGLRKIPIARTIAFMDTSQHEYDISSFLGELNRKYLINLSPKKIQNTFRSALFNHHNDQAVYALMTGHQYGHGIVSCHYYSVEQYVIGDFHAKTINHINQLALVNDSARNNFLELNSIGTKFPINPQMVRESIKFMLRNISYAKQLSINEYHNIFTSYIITMLGFATGYRAVTNPIETKYQIDFDFHLITISDKDNVNGFHTRVVPIPVILVEQLKVYEDYLKKLRLKINKPALEKKIQDLINGQKTTLPYLFFLGKSLNQISISPSKLTEFIEPALGLLPFNINRHYLRTQLSETNCKNEFIDYFMGHWELGEEPYNKYSFVSPVEIRNEVTPYIETILNRDGWKVVNHRYG